MRPTRGFTLLNLLITVAIISILAVMALKEYQGALKQFQPGAKGGDGTKIPLSNPNGNFQTGAITTQLKQIHVMEMDYHERNGHFASWDELVTDGAIPVGYSSREDDDKGIAFIRYYNIDIHAEGDGYVLLAFPNSEAAEKFPDQEIPAYHVDQTGQVREEEGYDDAAGASTDPDSDPDPFAGLGDMGGGDKPQ
ncbi:MAG: prepilin-type N-terminal cleavage/methylation domain-containing protein [bacterium]